MKLLHPLEVCGPIRSGPIWREIFTTLQSRAFECLISLGDKKMIFKILIILMCQS